MRKKVTKIIEFRYDGPWIEYTRTAVPSMVEHYKQQALRENPGAKVQARNK